MPDPTRLASPFVGGFSAAAVALLGSVQPTGAPLTDFVWVVLLGSLVGWSISSAPSLLLLAGSAVGALLLRTPLDAIPVVLLVVSAIVRSSASSHGTPHRSTLTAGGTLLAAAAMPWTILRLSDAGLQYLSAAAGFVLIALVLTTAVISGRIPAWLRIRWAAPVIASLCVLLIGLAFTDLLAARREATAAQHELMDAVTAMRGDDLALVSTQLDAAANRLRNADNRLHSWRITPLRYLPLTGPNVAVSRNLTRQMSAISESANQLASSAKTIDRIAGPEGLRSDELTPMLTAADETADRISALSLSLEQSSTTWLAPQLTEVVQVVQDELAPLAARDSIGPDIRLGVRDLIGDYGERRYLVLFGNPAEARELGGFAGGTALVSLDRGAITFERADRPDVLNESPATPHVFSEPQPQRFLEHRPWLYSQNYTAMSDFPTLATSLRDLYPEMGGSAIDGVIYLDTQAFAALLTLTGPVDVASQDEPVTAENVARLLTIDQYAQFDHLDDDTDRDEQIKRGEDRNNFLAELMDATFAQLLADPNPTEPAAGGRNLQPLINAIRQDRLLVYPFDPAAQRLTSSLGLSGAIAPIGPGDYLAVSHLNGGPNKLDAYLQRAVDYEVEIEPDTGLLGAVVTVTLTNNAPTNLPSYAGGNSHGYPSGTNRATVVVHTPHDLVRWTGGDEPELARSYREFDRWRHEHVVAIPQGESRTLTLELEGSINADEGYVLDVGHQPLVTADQFTVTALPYLDTSFTLWHDQTLASAG